MRSLPHLRAALGTVAFVAAILWWAPTFGVAFLRIAPHVVAALGVPRRVARVRRLIAQGDVDEADRVLAALTRERRAIERWRAGVQP